MGHAVGHLLLPCRVVTHMGRFTSSFGCDRLYVFVFLHSFSFSFSCTACCIFAICRICLFPCLSVVVFSERHVCFDFPIEPTLVCVIRPAGPAGRSHLLGVTGQNGHSVWYTATQLRVNNLKLKLNKCAGIESNLLRRVAGLDFSAPYTH